jgi:hypothetical protein
MTIRNTIRNTLSRFLVLLAVAAAVSGLPAVGQAEESAPWHSSLDQAQKLARESGKPIFAVFRCER